MNRIDIAVHEENSRYLLLAISREGKRWMNDYIQQEKLQDHLSMIAGLELNQVEFDAIKALAEKQKITFYYVDCDTPLS